MNTCRDCTAALARGNHILPGPCGQCCCHLSPMVKPWTCPCAEFEALADLAAKASAQEWRRSVRNKVNVALGKLSRRYHDDLNEMILAAIDTVNQTATEVATAGTIVGQRGNLPHDKGQLTVEVRVAGIKTMQYLCLSYYRMQSGRYELTAYLG